MRHEKGFRILTTTFEDPDKIDDATQVYGDQERFDDQVPDCCARNGGVAILADCCGVICAHCRKALAQ